jgi:DNA-binding LacI/PurR family transcriptional regulator
MGYELGMETAQLLIDRIESAEMFYEPVVKKLKTELVIRKST